MKTIYIKLSFLSICLSVLFACKKAEPLGDVNPPKLARLQIRGLVLIDTLEFVMDGKVIGTAIDGQVGIKDALYLVGDKVLIRKKADGKSLAEIVIAEKPFKQVKTIYYDGTTLTDGIEITPVKDPKNMGARFKFSSGTPLFYGGPVDVEIFLRTRTFEPFGDVYTSVKVIKNVDHTFSEFVELPPLESTDNSAQSYRLKFYKSGTTELPYLPGSDFSNAADPQNIYTNLSFNAGQSTLQIVNDSFEGNVFSFFQIDDISSAFQ